MSFISEIISSATEAECIELNESITDLAKRITSLKLDVKKFMDDSYIKLLPFMNDNTLLARNAKELADSVTDTQKRLDSQTKREMVGYINDLKDLNQSLVESALCVQIIDRLLEIDEAIKSARREQAACNYQNAAQLLFCAQQSLSDADGESLEWLDIYEPLSDELTKCREKYLFEAREKWRSSVSWDFIEVENKNKIVSLRILNNSALNEGLIKTLDLFGSADTEIKSFGESLMSDVLQPLMLYACTVTITDKNESTELALSINLKQKKPAFQQVLTNLMSVFDFVSTMLKIEVNRGNMFIALLGEFIAEQFMTLMVKDCLNDTIPLKREELKGYEKVIDNVRLIEESLLRHGFIENTCKILNNFYANIDELYVNKKCEFYLDGAKKLMKKDLHDMKQVGSVNIVDELQSYSARDIEETENMTSVISSNLDQFQQCQISKSVDEILKIVYEALNEAISYGDEYSVKFFDTARKVFIDYMNTMPVYHKNLIESIPQQSALLYNNMMYLASKVVTVEQEYKSKYPPLLASHASSFIDLVDQLRTAASNLIDGQLQKQLTQIVNTVTNSGLANLNDYEIFPQSVEKSIRQCIRQLILLQTVWQHVLPAEVYCKIIGLLCNTFLDEVIQKVISMKDIREDVATELVNVFSLVQDKVPSIFSDPNEIHRHVKRWSRFNELIKILSANLLEIAERWADGKGPLAFEFKPDQVRQLIKALFQVSDRRAAVLSRIN